ncbi:MAG: VacB/RNase II family 3'-5' exoribonuclease, partial [Steroidobacteraceae bacterium]|nr:VacB/RNase II family 3'-5' exoribonuclease [Steroidobacteraceae bacterium]
MAQGPVEGVVSANRAGYGFARVEGMTDSVFIPPFAMAGLMHGDRIRLTVRRDRDGRFAGEVLGIVEHGVRAFLGTIDFEGRTAYAVSADRRLSLRCQVAPAELAGARQGDWVIAEITRYPGAKGGAQARVARRLDPDRPVELATETAIARFSLPAEFPAAAIAEAAAFGREVDPEEAARRVDLRELPLVTIDGDDARDFDDAVFAEPDPDHAGGWRLLVAIADVAWYVRHDKPLDRAAYRRGTSVYFPDRVVPMLPEALSNGWCSLVPHEDRPVLVAEMWIDAEGHLKKHRFHRAMIRSAARLTYNRVQRAMDGAPDAEIAPLMEKVVRPLYGAYRVLLAAREKRGALDLDLPERQVTLGKDGRIAEIGVRERFDSHKLIEEFMVLANVAAAQALEQRHSPCMYRVHDQPDLAKLEALREFLGTLGVALPAGPRLRPGDLNRVLKQVEGKPTARLINETVLRSQSQAVYSPDNLGHFGLALPRYAHFTSPIRR